MDIASKIETSLVENLDAEYVRLDVDDRVTGFVVSSRFDGMISLDRQDLIEQTLSTSSPPLTREEQRQVLMIAAVTPDEYSSIGAQIRIHEINEKAGGIVEILLRGGSADAEYIRGVLNKIGGVEATSPKPVPGARFLKTIIVSPTGETPLSRAEVVRALEADRYIQIVKEQ